MPMSTKVYYQRTFRYDNGDDRFINNLLIVIQRRRMTLEHVQVKGQASVAWFMKIVLSLA